MKWLFSQIAWEIVSYIRTAVHDCTSKTQYAVKFSLGVWQTGQI